MSFDEVPVESRHETELEDVVKEVYKQIAKLQKEVEQTFRDIWSRLPQLPIPVTFGYFEPAFDIEDQGDEYVIYIDLPGFTRDEVKIRVTEDTVEVRAEKSEERKLADKNRNYIVRQRVYEGFYKKIDLPGKVRPESARARLADGVLEIHLPKSEKKREIEVSVE